MRGSWMRGRATPGEDTIAHAVREKKTKARRELTVADRKALDRINVALAAKSDKVRVVGDAYGGSRVVLDIGRGRELSVDMKKLKPVGHVRLRSYYRQQLLDLERKQNPRMRRMFKGIVTRPAARAISGTYPPER